MDGGSSVGVSRGSRDFGLLWLGQSISLIGTQIGTLALPLVAVYSLHADASELGVLSALRYLPFLVFALPLGPLIDRGDRRRLMLIADWTRAALIALVPLLDASGGLRMWCLFAVAFAVGVFQVVFDTSYLAFVPQLVSWEHLTRANRNLQASQSAADLGGPGLGGLVVAAVGAASALIFDALSFVSSAVTLSLMRAKDVARARSAQAPPAGRPIARWWGEMRSGISTVVHHPELRALALETATFNIFEQGVLTLYLLYAVRELGFSPALLGATLAATGVGSLAGSVLSGPAARRFGLGRTIMAGSAIGCASYLLVPAAQGETIMVCLVVGAGFAAAGFATGVSNVLQLSLRQASTPASFLGRMTATFRFVAYGTIPIGSLLGGFVGDAIGLRPALWLMSTGLLLGPVAILCSPVPHRQTLPRKTADDL